MQKTRKIGRDGGQQEALLWRHGELRWKYLCLFAACSGQHDSRHPSIESRQLTPDTGQHKASTRSSPSARRIKDTRCISQFLAPAERCSVHKLRFDQTSDARRARLRPFRRHFIHLMNWPAIEFRPCSMLHYCPPRCFRPWIPPFIGS